MIVPNSLEFQESNDGTVKACLFMYLWLIGSTGVVAPRGSGLGASFRLRDLRF